MGKSKKITSYDKAVEELQQIVRDIESEETGVDKLAEKIKRATELIGFCKEKLRNTEEEVQQTLEKLH